MINDSNFGLHPILLFGNKIFSQHINAVYNRVYLLKTHISVVLDVSSTKQTISIPGKGKVSTSNVPGNLHKTSKQNL